MQTKRCEFVNAYGQRQVWIEYRGEGKVGEFLPLGQIRSILSNGGEQSWGAPAPKVLGYCVEVMSPRDDRSGFTLVPCGTFGSATHGGARRALAAAKRLMLAEIARVNVQFPSD